MVNQNWGPYDRDSWNPVYGNQLFMKTRNGSMKQQRTSLTLTKQVLYYLQDSHQTLLQLLLWIGKATKQQTNIDVIYERVRDDYQLHWTSTNWKGTNTKDKMDRSFFRKI